MFSSESFSPRHERYTDSDFFRVVLKRGSEIAQNALISYTSESFVLDAVHVLDIKQKEIGHFKEALEQNRICLATGV